MDVRLTSWGLWEWPTTTKKTDASHEKRQLMIKLHGSVFIDNTARRETARARENARNTPNSCQRK